MGMEGNGEGLRSQRLQTSPLTCLPSGRGNASLGKGWWGLQGWGGGRDPWWLREGGLREESRRQPGWPTCGEGLGCRGEQGAQRPALQEPLHQLGTAGSGRLGDGLLVTRPPLSRKDQSRGVLLPCPGDLTSWYS